MSFLTVRSSAPPTRRPRRQRLRASGTILSLIAALAFAPIALFATPAMAASGPYVINGVVPDAGATQLEDPEGSVKELGPLNSSTTKIGVIHADAVPTLGMTNPNAQVDLRQAWVKLTRHSDGKDWLYFAWERDSNTGSGFIAYEFMKNAAPTSCAYGSATDAALIAGCNPWANRAVGDFMILWDQQGGSRDLDLRVWGGTAGNLVLGPPVDLIAAVSEAQYSADGFRGEAAVNLTDAVPGSSTGCRTIANTIPSTVTGNSDTADYKDTILTRTSLSTCTGSIVTTPSKVDGTPLGASTSITTAGVAAVKDSALISVVGGATTAAGTVSFSLCKIDVGTCTTGGTSIGSTAVTGSYPATVLSPTAYVTSAGRYCWRGDWSGDPANDLPARSDSSAGECFTVDPVTPTLSTNASADVTLGGSVSDTATLSGTAPQPTAAVIHTSSTTGADAAGTITFRLYGPQPAGGGCGPLVHTSAPVPVSGDDDYTSGSFAPASTGTYSWVAEYSGNLPNTLGRTHNAACTDGNENVEVTSVPSSLFTEQTWVPNDSATVSAPAGSGDLDGAVTFTLYPTSDCTGTPVFPSATVDVAGASPKKVSTSNTVAVSASGSFSWKVSYDSDNPAQRDIGNSCHETSVLTVLNGGTVSSTP